MTEAAQAAEAQGFTEVRVADHPGTTFDPFVLLSHFAAHTTTIRLGTYVLNLGVRHPLDVAIASVSLDAVSGGRFTLGIGAGHTPAEWNARGAERPNIDGRVRNFLEVADALPALMAGEEVSFDGQHIQLDSAQIDKPTAAQQPIPILVGGSNRRLLRWGARHASIIGMTGMGPTKADGHKHEVRWAPEATTERVDVVRTEAAAHDRLVPVIDALVQRVVLTNDRETTASEFAEPFPELDTSHALDNPFALFGTPESIAAQLVDFEQRWGITHYCVRGDAVDAVVQVMAALGDRS